MEKRLVRSSTDRVLAGVCGGLGQYLGVDPILVRVAFILFLLSGGAGLLVYLILWLVIPGEENEFAGGDFSARANRMRDEFVDVTSHPNPKAVRYAGVTLVALGVLYLLRALDIRWLYWLDGDVIWPLLLIVVGAILLSRAFGGRKG